jgi:hypothetical protein
LERVICSDEEGMGCEVCSFEQKILQDCFLWSFGVCVSLGESYEGEVGYHLAECRFLVCCWIYGYLADLWEGEDYQMIGHRI